MTLRTELPQASRVVIFAAARRRISARRIVDVDVVELKILARGDVGDAVGIFLGQIGHGFELIGVHAAAGNLDALHARRVPHRVGTFGQLAGWIGNVLDFGAVVALAVVVTLAVGAAPQARFGEKALVYLALFPQGDFGFENVDFASQMFRHLAG